MEVAEDREELLDQVHTAPTEAEDTKQPLDQVHVSSTEDEAGKAEDTKVVKATPKRKRRAVATGAGVREKKATKRKPRTEGS
jgi:hypothetical protein